MEDRSNQIWTGDIKRALCHLSPDCCLCTRRRPRPVLPPSETRGAALAHPFIKVSCSHRNSLSQGSFVPWQNPSGQTLSQKVSDGGRYDLITQREEVLGFFWVASGGSHLQRCKNTFVTQRIRMVARRVGVHRLDKTHLCYHCVALWVIK